jgi:transcriptional regulator with XRE-family HTH domain
MRERAIALRLSRNVELHRASRGWSKAALAEMAGVPRSTITRLEQGVHETSLTNVAKIRTALGVTWDALLGEPHIYTTREAP